ncbi:DUF4124 domain-containing protein [Gilvimarinus algae]|uniref:DUF4124 domain-containing protein n=1 Tax=Gilvimarinus algae TaxID=3058037 RepID=A0ABT8TBJ4_9GAMM|nr:DUF4124 domain-containing protein [Gilvimarinus sp. SDUM040014]MDO3381393.1 DUF4124 domain-containing protein [Gilvimarinus sp. SDUM040014]
MTYSGVIGALVLLLSAGASAELYRWTDANGKVHYSDRQPADNSAKDAEVIDDKLKPVNIDDSHEEREALRHVFPDEPLEPSPAEQRQASEREQALKEHCRKAREYLRAVSGPVQFIDENGEMVDVSERERQERQAEMEAYVEKHCSGVASN